MYLLAKFQLYIPIPWGVTALQIKVATTKQLICTEHIGEINYRCLQKWL